MLQKVVLRLKMRVILGRLLKGIESDGRGLLWIAVGKGLFC
jgi:hypothetical protein